jgi:hypothetical protein
LSSVISVQARVRLTSAALRRLSARRHHHQAAHDRRAHHRRVAAHQQRVTRNPGQRGPDRAAAPQQPRTSPMITPAISATLEPEMTITWLLPVALNWS